MKKPVGLLLIISWCLLRGLAGTWGGIGLASRAPWTDVIFVLAVEGAIWLWLGFGLLSRWNFARWVTVIWCAVIIVWSSYGFYTVALPRWSQFRYAGIYGLTVTIHGAIIVYLLRQRVARLFKFKEQSAT